MIFTGNDVDIFEKFKSSMKSEFDMTNLGKLKYFLDVKIQQSSEDIHMCKRKYAHKFFDRFGMKNCNSVKNPIVPCTKLTKK